MAVLGPAALGDADIVELLAMPDKRGSKRVAAAAAKIGRLSSLASATGTMLMRAGLTAAEADRVLAAVELSARLYRPPPRSMVRGPADVYHQVLDLIGAAEVEKLVVLSLDRRGGVLARDVVSMGSVSATVVDPPTILRTTLRNGAWSLALAHNHPSGDPTPSHEDVRATRMVAAACDALGIPLVDHVVVAGALWRSMADAGHLPRRLAA